VFILRRVSFIILIITYCTFLFILQNILIKTLTSFLKTITKKKTTPRYGLLVFGAMGRKFHGSSHSKYENVSHGMIYPTFFREI
jgi:hypothetical protein